MEFTATMSRKENEDGCGEKGCREKGEGAVSVRVRPPAPAPDAPRTIVRSSIRVASDTQPTEIMH